MSLAYLANGVTPKNSNSMFLYNSIEKKMRVDWYHNNNI